MFGSVKVNSVGPFARVAAEGATPSVSLFTATVIAIGSLHKVRKPLLGSAEVPLLTATPGR